MLDNLKIKLGMKKYSYVSSADSLNVISIGEASYESLRVEQKEVYDALAYGRIPESLEMGVKKLKSQK